MELEKRSAARAAAELLEQGMVVGLGTGSTVAHLLPALAERGIPAVYVASSPATEDAARALGLELRGPDDVEALDLYIDGADQITPDLWLVKGGGGAHTREKLLATRATRFVVIASSDKLVPRLTPPVPLEVLPFGAEATLRALGAVARPGLSANGCVLADYEGPVGDPRALATQLSETPGVVEHGLFPPELVSSVLVGLSRIEPQRDR
jgi:ribose 5-phosphate isomerase A